LTGIKFAVIRTQTEWYGRDYYCIVRVRVDLSGFEPGQSAYVSSSRRHLATAASVVLLPPAMLLLLLHVIRWCHPMSSATQHYTLLAGTYSIYTSKLQQEIWANA